MRAMVVRTKVRAKQGRARGKSAPEVSQGDARRHVRRPSAGPARLRQATAASAVAVQSERALDEFAAFGEEETIESSKYVPGRPTRLFEEERFLFPQTYGVSRARLLVKDPDWLFAYWDVDPQAMDDLRGQLGERVVALSRITLRVQDPTHGGGIVILVPAGARSWYVRTDAAQRAYRAELGVTLPSGEFRSLAVSNTAIVPRRGPSEQPARRVVSWKQPAQGLAVAEGALPEASVPAAGPWHPVERSSPSERPLLSESPAPKREGTTFGGASDVHSRH